MSVQIVLDGPGKNSLSTPMMEGILRRLDAAPDEAILFSGKGDTLSAGLNLKEVASLDAPAMERFVRLVEEVMIRIFHHPSPTVACVNGHAIAGGCVITLCCDYRVATTDARARIGLNEVALGLVFPPKIMSIVKHRVPPRSLYEVTLRGALYAPADALRLGLVDEVSEDALATAQARVDELAALPREAYAAVKRALHQNVAEDSNPDAYEAQLRTALPAWTSEDVRARIRARLPR